MINIFLMIYKVWSQQNSSVYRKSIRLIKTVCLIHLSNKEKNFNKSKNVFSHTFEKTLKKKLVGDNMAIKMGKWWTFSSEIFLLILK